MKSHAKGQQNVENQFIFMYAWNLFKGITTVYKVLNQTKFGCHPQTKFSSIN